MPGKVTGLSVKAGETVKKGQPLLVLEAMKMEHALTAPFDGVVDEVAVALGAQVTEGAMLVKLTPTPDPLIPAKAGTHAAPGMSYASRPYP
jgi:3-methylcrotonyl-CoA carboxylase alpha subunit